ncbi:fibrobacter succinogenes major paralogous domain-containing protein [Fibrobacter sp.]|uniref:fibrobacter succinogenes major paralogous domain-containing protein n=1 Tax=Fibrobacter sp. TaxID=35828 RepID=UPI00389056FB
MAMKNVLVQLAVVFIFAACSESFTDPRDGQSYDIVQIGPQTWMAENLNYETEGSACPEGDNRNCSKYGRLYTWKAAQKACPEGWHLPDRADFEQLIASAGGTDLASGMAVAGEKLKSTSGWFKKGNGSDEFGFNALPAGYRLGGSESAPGKFDGIGGYAHLWSATETADGLAYYMLLDFSTKAAKLSAFGKDEARSVRCVKE